MAKMPVERAQIRDRRLPGISAQTHMDPATLESPAMRISAPGISPPPTRTHSFAYFQYATIVGLMWRIGVMD